ncbi:fumarylacetoacetate hydrolase family protein [Devosia ginsengisoli]|uniref:Fumarylacetoacetate hydrolase family protein n=1 Tax=Devosia ginsengisoli TaxID=400770 RepID=A0A5B8LUA9_9HYPH|nr:fumarylacetoacetate hydrolase family protein [Devosia ginsengisoli]QDZ11355.1 fumarylacetoacetate hydrolase family protein [Devosia ginsengisoli]
MKFASFNVGDSAHYGPVSGEVIHAVPDRMRGQFPDLKSAIAGQALEQVAAAALRDGTPYPLASLQYAPVIANPGKIICVGLNYRAHGDETGRPDYPALFVRFADTQIGHGENLTLSAESAMFDFEGELAVVIGTPGHGIAEAAALDHIAGYACYNDATMRDWQRHSSQYTAGKNFPGTGAFGPFLVTADEVGDPSQLAIATRVDGAVMQSASTADMLFSVRDIIAYVSRFTPLAAGDVLVTGTPAGAGAGRKPPVFLTAGMVVEVEIERVGLLRNVVAAVQ